MKKTYIALAVLAMAALAGCQETEFNSNEIYIPKEGEVLLRVSKSDKTTKSADFRSEVKGATISLGTADNGTDYVLEETITRLDDIMYAPATKGTPAYTENFSDLYGGFNAAVYKNGSVFEADGAFTEVDKDNLIYKRQYPNSIWDKKTEGAPNLYFFLRTPADYIDANTLDEDNNPTLTYDPSDGSISFSYTSPATASAQKDMLFTSRPLTSVDEFNDYFIKANEGLPVLFHHALTGVKFAIAADVKDKVTITGVKFTGLADGGECVVSPKMENIEYTDVTDDYSSASVSIWDPEKLTFGGTEFSQTFSGVVSYESAGTGKAHFGESFYLAGNNNNLNDANASETFWFIPQAMTDDVKLTIYYGDNDEWTIDFGTTLKNKNVTWKAGELHTYTIRIDDVNVKIEDSVTIGEGQTTTYTDDKGNTHTIYGGTKNGISITNTGDTDAFIRAAITGQWVDADGAPVFSFTDFTVQDIIQEIASWYNDQFGTGNGHFGVFDGLVGYTKNGKTGAGNTGWVKGNDGYYYYNTKVAPGATTGTALFNSYTVTLASVPKIKVAGALQEVHFVMEISTQAISAKKLDGSDYTWNVAWDNALGYDPSK